MVDVPNEGCQKKGLCSVTRLARNICNVEEGFESHTGPQKKGIDFGTELPELEYWLISIIVECSTVTAEEGEHNPYEPQNSRVINLNLEGSKLPINYGVEGTEG